MSAGRLSPLLTVLLVAGVSTTASALPLLGGDIIVADPNAFGGGGGLIRVDPTTGFQDELASGGSFLDPVAIGREVAGTLVVADLSGTIIRVDPGDGSQTVVSAGGNLSAPVGIVVEADGTLLVADGGFDGLIRIDPTDGSQTTFSTGFGLTPAGLALDALGDIFVTDSFNDRVVKIDADDGGQTVVAGFPVPGMDFFEDPRGIVLDDNDAIVADALDISVINVDLGLGANNQTILTSGGNLCGPYGVGLEADGAVLVVDMSAFGASCAVDGPGGVIRLSGGGQIVVSSAGLFVDPQGILLIPMPEPSVLFQLAAGLFLMRRWGRMP